MKKEMLKNIGIVGLVVFALLVVFFVGKGSCDKGRMGLVGSGNKTLSKKFNADQIASIDKIDKFKVVKVANGFLTATNPSGKLPCGASSKLPAGTITVIVDLSKADIIGAASKIAHLQVGDIVNIVHIDGHHRIMVEKVFCE